MQWLENLEPGDRLFVERCTIARSHIRPATVKRTTKTQVVVVSDGGVERKFYKKNGHRVGEYRGDIGRDVLVSYQDGEQAYNLQCALDEADCWIRHVKALIVGRLSTEQQLKIGCVIEEVLGDE